MRYLVSLIILALAAAPLHAKALAAPAAKKDSMARRVMSYSELFAEIRACKDTVYALQNAIIRFDEQKDSAFTQNYTRTDKIYIQPSILFSHVRIEGSAYLKNVVFERELRLNDVEGIFERNEGCQLFFVSCELKALLLVQSSQLKTLSFYGCAMSNVLIDECLLQSLFIRKCSINAQRTLEEISKSFLITGLEDRAFGISSTTITKSCTIGNSRFQAQSGFKSLIFTVCTFELFFCQQNIFDMDVVFAGLKVNRRCAIERCQLRGRFAVPGLTIVNESAVIDWKQFAVNSLRN